MSFQMYTPQGAGAVFYCRSTTTYTADAYGFISAVALTDVSDLVGQGCVPMSAVIRNNLTATTDPVVTSDSASDYSAGSLWVNTTTGRVWTCVSAAVGAAVWSSSAPTTLPTLSTDSAVNLASGSYLMSTDVAKTLFLLPDPVVGRSITITKNIASTAIQVISPANSSVVKIYGGSIGGSTGTTITSTWANTAVSFIKGIGQSVTLFCPSTGIWVITAATGATSGTPSLTTT